MKKNTGFIVLGLVTLIGAGATLAAGLGGHGPGGHRGGGMQQHVSARLADLEDYLDVTADQRAAIEQIKQDTFKQLDARKQAAAQTQRPDVGALLKADKLDTAQLYAMAKQHAARITDMADIIVPAVEKAHAVLTPAQRAKLADRIEKRRQSFGFGGPGE